MSEEHTDSESHRSTEIGIDGKPFESWTPAVGEGEAPIDDQSYVRAESYGPTESAAGYFDMEESRQVGEHPPWAPAPVDSSGSIVPDVASPPESTMARNKYAWLSIGLGGFALVSNMSVFFGRGGGLTWTASFLLAAAGLYFGLRSGSVSSRGYSPQRSLRIAGMSLSILAAVSTVVLIARFLTALSRIF